MAEDRAPEGHHRIFNDDAEGLTVTAPGPEHSEKAMTILREQGVEAYQRYIEKHAM